MERDVRSAEVEFWLTNAAPGWNRDDQMHAWPTFQFDGIYVNAHKSPSPCELHFSVFGEPTFRLDVTVPCPVLIESPYVVRGVHVRLAWRDSETYVFLNGQPVESISVNGQRVLMDKTSRQWSRCLK